MQRVINESVGSKQLEQVVELELMGHRQPRMDDDELDRTLDAIRAGELVDDDGNPVRITIEKRPYSNIEDLKHMSTDDLVEEWKSLVDMNCIIGQVTLSEVARIHFIELEMNARGDEVMAKYDLVKWFEEAEADWLRQDSEPQSTDGMMQEVE